MLERLLDEIHAGGAADPATLAARLNVSPPLVQAMLEHLARLGQLKEVTACAQSACHACAMNSACRPIAHEPRAWVLAGKADDQAL
jgi:hypothetical protein